MKSHVILGLLAFGLAVAWVTVAQTPPGPPPPPPAAPEQEAPAAAKTATAASDGEMRDLAEIVMAVKLARDLGLNDEQTVILSRRFSEFRQKGDEMKKHRLELVKAVKTAIRDKAPDAEIQAKLDAVIKQDEELVAFRKDAYDKVSQQLTPANKAKLYVFLGEFEGEMRQLIQRVRERKQERNAEVQGAPERPGGGEGYAPRLRHRLLGGGAGRPEEPAR